MTASLEFRLLGPVEALVDGARVDLGGARRRGVLAVLVLDAGRVVPVARLIEGVWGEAAPETAVTALHGHISQLRRALGDAVIVTQVPGYRLEAPDAAIDVRRLERAVELARRDLAAGDAPAARATLAAAPGGPPLADLRDAPFAAIATPWLEELVTAARDERTEADLALGQGEELVLELRGRVAADPLRERPRRQLMQALHRAGRRAEGLAVYEEGRRALSEELGIDPSAALRALHAELLQEEEAVASAPPEAPRRRRRRALPVALAVVVAGAAAAVLATVGGDPVVAALEGPGVVRIDAESLAVAAAVPIRGTPAVLAAGRNSAWVIDADDQTVSELSEAGGVTRTFATGATPTGIAVASDGLWLTEGAGAGAGAQSLTPRTVAAAHLAGSLLAVRTRARLPAGPGDEDPGGGRVAVGVDAVWAIAAGGDLARLDAGTGRVEQVFRINARAVATDGARAWVLTGDATLVPVTETESTTGDPIAVATGAAALAVGGGAVWFSDPDAGTVTRIDPEASTEAVETTVGAGAGAIAYGAGAAWVLDALRGRVVRLDAGTAEVTGAVEIGQIPRALAVADGSVWVSATPRSSPLAAACTTTGPADADVRIVAELPLRRGERSPTAEMARAIASTVERRGHRAGPHRVEITLCDDSTAALASFDPEKCAANARGYAADERVVVEIGPYNSGCAEQQIPVAAAAPNGPLGMVSPTATDPRLTMTRHTGAFTRIIATDADQAAVMAAELRRRGVRRVLVLDDEGGRPTYGATLAGYFTAAATRAGLQVVGRVSWPRLAGGALRQRVRRAKVDAVYLSGSLDRGAGEAIRRLEPGPLLAGSDLLLPVGSLFAASAGAARGMLVTTTFARGGPVVYAEEATEVALNAVGRSDGSRRSVAAALRSTERLGPLGTIRFDADGNRRDPPVALLEVRRAGSRQLLSTDGARVLAVRHP